MARASVRNGFTSVFVFLFSPLPDNLEAGPPALACFIITALCPLSRRWLFMEQTAQGREGRGGERERGEVGGGGKWNGRGGRGRDNVRRV